MPFKLHDTKKNTEEKFYFFTKAMHNHVKLLAPVPLVLLLEDFVHVIILPC